MFACFSIFIFSVKCTCTVFILMVVSFFYTFYLGAALQQQCIKHLILCKFFVEIVFQNFVFFFVKPCKVVVNIVWSLVHQNIVYHTVSFYLIRYFNKRVLPVKFEMFSGWQIVCMTWKTRYIMLVWVFQMCTADMSYVLGTSAISSHPDPWYYTGKVTCAHWHLQEYTAFNLAAATVF